MPSIARPPLLLALAIGAVVACSGGGETIGGPAGRVVLVQPNGAQAAVVGSAWSYDASKGGAAFRDSAGGGLTYQLTIAAGSGLVANGARLTGTPAAPGVYHVRLEARDVSGGLAVDTFSVAVFAAGLPTPSLPATPFAYSDASAPLPAHFDTPGFNGGPTVRSTDNTPAGNAITDAGATLGRVLFHDTRLSADDRFACASCHVQAFGFTDSARVSSGINGGRTARHSMPLANARFYRPGRFFWDHRAASAEAQVVQPIQDANEMGMTLPNMVTKLRLTPYYGPLFTQAFGTPEVTSDRVARALSQYVRSIVTRRARFDSAFTAQGAPAFAAFFTAQELEGQQLFNGPGRCVQCHETWAQVGRNAFNIGLDAADTDNGAGAGAFKSPSLRNVAVRRRFMHDGRFTTLDQVIDFYDTGVQDNPNLDQRLRDPQGQPLRLNLTAAQKAALKAYLETFTDRELITAERFSDPFLR